MRKSRSGKRRVSGATGTKLLITTVSLAATLGLWNLFSTKGGAVLTTQLLSSVMLELPPVPTLVPSLAEPVVIIEPQQPDLQPAPTLRAVSAPTPAPVTTTQSSR